MSYAGPEFDSSQPRRPRRRPLTLALAVLVPGALLGWLVYAGVSGAADGGATPAAASPRASAPPTVSSTTAEDKKPLGSLRGKVVVIDPGHNLTNFRHTAEINRKVDIGTNRKECDTTGTSTNSGYAEAKFTLDVAHRLRTLLEKRGATVKLTQDGDRPYGPCVDERARIGNTAHADAVVSIHADGASAGQRGYHVILPGRVHKGIADTRRIVAPSAEARRAHRARLRTRDAHRPLQLRRRRHRTGHPHRPGRPQPLKGAQGVHRMRQHARQQGRGPPHERGLAAEGRAGNL